MAAPAIGTIEPATISFEQTDDRSSALGSTALLDIVQGCLHAKPSEWIFLRELSVGTGFRNSAAQRLDAFALNCFAHTSMKRVCYEVKTSRADFLCEMKQPLKRRIGLRYSNEFYFVTRVSYQSYLDTYIRPRWADTPIANVRAMAVEDWLKHLKLAPKTRGRIRSLMSTLFKCAQRWELIENNPIQLVRVKNVSRRLERPAVLTAEDFHTILLHIREPYRTMVLIAGCLGLRASEIVGLQWKDFDFNKSTLLVQRGVVHGRVDDVKTKYSRDSVPIAPELAKELLSYRNGCYPTQEGWLFANPAIEKPYDQEEIQKKHIRTAGKAAGINLRVG